jgi:L-amino acid N-acyltransferase YncA
MPRKSPAIRIRPAHLEDFEEIYDAFCDVLDEGKTYAYTREEMTPDRSLAYWMSAPGTHCFLAETQDKKMAGFYAIRPNWTGRADHVANGSFIVCPSFRGLGIGRMMGKHALRQAKKLGYKAMLFRFVVSTNKTAITLYESLGFSVVGTLPKVFRHASKGMVDILIMHRFL